MQQPVQSLEISLKLYPTVVKKPQCATELYLIISTLLVRSPWYRESVYSDDHCNEINANLDRDIGRYSASNTQR